ncbi:MAG: CBS domain-containing protein [Desulfobulbaceae bacterium]|nr:CBS domain-containing protein [Desulfobulbaceae bacterium]
MEKRTLADILTSDVITVAPETMISEALRLMRSNNISCILALKGKRPTGIITERNVVKYIASQSDFFADCQVSEIMSSPVITAARDTSIFEAYSLLSQHGMRHLAVVDTTGSLCGVVTLSNLVEHLTYESFMEMKQISAVMTQVVFTVAREINIREALVQMAEKAVSCIVVTDGRHPVGIVTERDASRLLMDYSDLSRVTVGEVMSSSLQSIPGDTPLPLAIDLMKRKKLRRLVVVDQEGNIEGLATQSDIVKGLEGKYIQALNEIIREKDHLIRHTSRDLEEKTAYLDNILRSSLDYGIIAADLNLRVIYFNPGAELILGIPADQVLGQDIRTLHSNTNGLLARLQEVLHSISNGERVAFIIERHREERKQYLNARASGIIDKQKKLAGYFLMISDITNRKEAEEALRNAHDDLEQRVEIRTRELAKAMNGTIEAIALTVEMRDPYTSGHQRRVADLAAAIARRLGHTLDKIEGVYMAGLLHDIGKIRVPSGILCHPGQLTEAEYAIIKPHPEVGYNILKGIDFPWPLADIVLQHHERLDGSGYPQGLTGDRILPKAKILTVADVVEALSSHRPYRPALGIDRAIEEITANRGTLYDPEAVDACVALFTKDNYVFPPHSREFDPDPPKTASTQRSPQTAGTALHT